MQLASGKKLNDFKCFRLASQAYDEGSIPFTRCTFGLLITANDGLPTGSG